MKKILLLLFFGSLIITPIRYFIEEYLEYKLDRASIIFGIFTMMTVSFILNLINDYYEKPKPKS